MPSSVMVARRARAGGARINGGCRGKSRQRILTEALAKGGEVAKRAFEAMMKMQKIDVAKIEAAVRGKTIAER